MLYLSDKTAFRVVSVGVGRTVVATEKNLQKEPQFVVELELKLHRILPVRCLPLPHFEPDSMLWRDPQPLVKAGNRVVTYPRPGNYEYVFSW